MAVLETLRKAIADGDVDSCARACACAQAVMEADRHPVSRPTTRLATADPVLVAPGVVARHEVGAVMHR